MAASKHQNEEEKQNNKNYNHPNAVIATSPVRLGRQTRPACTAVNVVVIVLMGFFEAVRFGICANDFLLLSSSMPRMNVCLPAPALQSTRLPSRFSQPVRRWLVGWMADWRWYAIGMGTITQRKFRQLQQQQL